MTSPAADFPSERASRVRSLWLALGLCVACFITYAPMLHGGFIVDDTYLVVDNTAIRELGNVPAFFVRTPPGPIVRNFYRPVMLSSFALDYALFGAGPAGFHATNLLLHAAAVLLVAQLLAACGAGMLASFCGALLFAVHPLQSEAVDVVNYRSATLAAIFFFAALLHYLRARQRPWTLASAAGLGVLYFLALGSKETGITLPAIMLLCDVLLATRESADTQSARTRWLPYLITGGVALFYLVLRHALCEPATFSYFGDAPVATVLMTMTFVEAYALSLVVSPRELAGVYDLHFLPNVTAPSDPRFWCSVLIFAALSVAAWRAHRRWPLVTLAWAFYLVTLAPTTQLLGRLPVVFGERFLYLPLFGAALLVSFAVERAAALPARAGQVVAALLVLAVCAVLATQSFLRTAEFLDQEGFWRAAVASEPASAQAQIGLATTLRAEKRCAEALPYFERAMQLTGAGSVRARPVFGEAASCYSFAGQRDRALLVVQHWLAAHPEDSGFRSMERALAATRPNVP